MNHSLYINNTSHSFHFFHFSVKIYRIGSNNHVPYRLHDRHMWGIKVEFSMFGDVLHSAVTTDGHTPSPFLHSHKVSTGTKLRSELYLYRPNLLSKNML